MTGCYLCKGYGCDDCFEKECNQMKPIYDNDIDSRVK